MSSECCVHLGHVQYLINGCTSAGGHDPLVYYIHGGSGACDRGRLVLLQIFDESIVND